MSGNNIPFVPGDAKAPKGGTPVQKFGRKHSVPNDMRTERLLSHYPTGNAYGKGQPDNMAVLQRAAGKRLMQAGSSTGFNAPYSRNTSG